MKRLAYLSVLPILGAFFMAFSLEKVIDHQVVEESSKYFKIVRGEKMNIKKNDMSKLALMGLKKDEITFFIGFDRLSKESIEDARRYFKDYGFTVNIVNSQSNKNGKLVNIELSLLEDDIKNKQIGRERNYDMYNDGGRFDLEEFKKMSKGDKGYCLSIRANKKTGQHSVTLVDIALTPPPPPPAPPLPPPPPPVPPKVGLNEPQNQNSIIPVYADKEVNKYGGGAFMLLSNHKSKLIFAGRNIKKGAFLSEIVTQKDWKIFLDYINNDDYFSKKFRKDMIPDYWDKIKVISEKIPVGFVAWNQAEEYCKWQSEMFSFNPQNIKNPNYRQIIASNATAKLTFKCRLPTEKEWETLMKKNQGYSGFRYILETTSI